MSEFGIFPFGQPIRKVEQKDRSPKNVFVLGVYASAVHARWIGPDGKKLITAVGVASEPEIFWRGDGVDKILEAIELPKGAGRLEATAPSLNGPSGCSLDEYFLNPLGVDRKSAWLCDLVPHSCMNDSQESALERTYDLKRTSLKLPKYNWGKVPGTLADEARRKAIEQEIAEAKPEILITLGDLPLKWFTRFHGSKSTLAGYGTEDGDYGQAHEIQINGRTLDLLPLVHPRQAGRLGRHSKVWAELHEKWCGRGK